MSSLKTWLCVTLFLPFPISSLGISRKDWRERGRGGKEGREGGGEGGFKPKWKFLFFLLFFSGAGCFTKRPNCVLNFFLPPSSFLSPHTEGFPPPLPPPPRPTDRPTINRGLKVGENGLLAPLFSLSYSPFPFWLCHLWDGFIKLCLISLIFFYLIFGRAEMLNVQKGVSIRCNIPWNPSQKRRAVRATFFLSFFSPSFLPLSLRARRVWTVKSNRRRKRRRYSIWEKEERRSEDGKIDFYDKQ